jgi:hypothetical protein
MNGAKGFTHAPSALSNRSSVSSRYGIIQASADWRDLTSEYKAGDYAVER